jgi:hypothetical protein
MTDLYLHDRVALVAGATPGEERRAFLDHHDTCWA